MVKESVLPHLHSVTQYANGDYHPDRHSDPIWQRRSTIAYLLREFIKLEPDVSLWGYYADYDHVILCQLFGTMMDLPPHFPKFTMDIKQLCVSLGDPKLPEQGKSEHHSLLDARWNKLAYEFLKDYECERSMPANVRGALLK